MCSALRTLVRGTRLGWARAGSRGRLGLGLGLGLRVLRGQGHQNVMVLGVLDDKLRDGGGADLLQDDAPVLGVVEAQDDERGEQHVLVLREVGHGQIAQLLQEIGRRAPAEDLLHLLALDGRVAHDQQHLVQQRPHILGGVDGARLWRHVHRQPRTALSMARADGLHLIHVLQDVVQHKGEDVVELCLETVVNHILEAVHMHPGNSVKDAHAEESDVDQRCGKLLGAGSPRTRPHRAPGQACV
mmetsp:Transcript_36522/g.61073  ORF Transcript_36522/g.61073 Transcript_36522/m.61073 type:complete len:243 (+) Transcript_36522:144-872(+)